MVRKNPKRKMKISGSPVERVKKSLEKMKYGFVGSHSAVKVCRWTKNSLSGDSGCWKEQIYGVSSAGCVQMSPSVMWCENHCVHCWRPIEMNLGTDLPMVDSPKRILDGIISRRKELMMGLKGKRGVDLEKFDESLEPSLFTMSLSGEPTIYPRLGELFGLIRKRGAVSFLVTNGLNPDALLSLNINGGEFPTQLTISMNAPNKELFNKWHRSLKKNAWDLFNDSLGVMSSLDGKVRRAVRLTLVNGSDSGLFSGFNNMEDGHVRQYADLILKANPDFVHVKGFKSVGYARKRMDYSKQPWHGEVKVFAKKLESLLPNYDIKAENERSCIVMLARKGSKIKIDKV